MHKNDCLRAVVFYAHLESARGEGIWVQMDVIEDVSHSRESVLHMAERFNALHLSPLHFRDVVMGRVSM